MYHRARVLLTHIIAFSQQNNTIFTRHESHKDNCAHYIQSTVCAPSASGDGCDCSTPDKCVACAMQYHTGDDYFFSYDCSGRSNPLEEIRAMCNATQGRVSSPIIPTKVGATSEPCIWFRWSRIITTRKEVELAIAPPHFLNLNTRTHTRAQTGR